MSKQKQHASLDTSLVTKGVHCTSAVKKKETSVKSWCEDVCSLGKNYKGK